MGRPTIPWLPVFDQVNFQTLHSSSRQTDPCTVSYAACVHFLRHEIDLLEKDTHTIIDLVIDKTVKK
jgi:hypothetical protein